MPYPYANKLLVWPHSCEKVSFASRMKLEAAMDENCFAQMIAGKALVRHGEKSGASHGECLYYGGAMALPACFLPYVEGRGLW